MGIYAEPRFLPGGDLALSVELGDDINREVNARVLALEYLIQQRGLSGVTETVPSYRSLLVYYDPLIVGWDALTKSLHALWREARPEVLPRARTVEVPCCYEGELGFELEAAAEKIGLPADEVARLRIFIPRLVQPRLKTPPGSVSIGGIQCCIYSVESPGGFWVLGRTPLRLYDPESADPILLRAGDHVHFTMITRSEYDAIAAAVADGTYAPRVTVAP